jgi:PHS family inorganic phosphate transporter-like MFS transporter
MLATVFYMQSVGQICATLVSIAVVAGKRDDSLPQEAQKVIVDRIWRWVIGVGVLPAVFV